MAAMTRQSRVGRMPLRLFVVAGCLVVLAAAIGIERLDGGSAVASAASSASGTASAGSATAASLAPTAQSSDESATQSATSAASSGVAVESAIARTPAPSTGSGASVGPTIDGLVPGSVNATSINLSAEYVATVRLNFGTRTFIVSSTMNVTNTSGKAIDRLELNTIAARLGRMTLTTTRVDNVPVHATVSDQTIHLPLGGILEPGATTTVRIAYRATLRSTTSGSSWLFTRTNGVLEAHRWLPWISVPTAFDRPNHGDPFVTPVSPLVRITIVADRPIRWATTGEQVASSGNTKTFEARNVRDFAFVGAPDYRITSATVNGVIIRVLGRPGFPLSTVLAAAKTALSREARLLGAYPYRTYEVAQTAGGFGMESPGLTWIPAGAGSLGYLVAHETAHQWFYGIVGNDQARQPYADEAAADFVARHVLGLRRTSRCSSARLDLSIYRYSAACYYEDIYIQGGNFLDDTRKKMGSTAFWAGMRDYLATYRFMIAGTKALLNTLDAHTPLNLIPRYRTRFPSMY
jgi:hypothetical protein